MIDTLQTQVQKGYRHLRKQIVYMFLFGLAFMFLGDQIPKLYYKHIDKTQYYQLAQPIPVDKNEYKSCERQIWSTTRSALVPLNVTFTNSLIRMDDTDPQKFERLTTAEPLVLTVPESNTTPVSLPVTLPCNLENGLYFWQGIASYRTHDTDKNYLYVTVPFRITN